MTALATTIQRVGDEREAVELAARLNSTQRSRPVVVVTTASRRDQPYIDAEQIADAVGDAADVVVLPNGDASWAFSREMPAGTQVYGGAGRVYPVGVEWVRDLRKSPLRMAFSDAEGERVTAALITDALHMAVAAGLLGQSTSSVPKRFSATVTGTVAGQALVKGENGVMATIAPELIVPGVDIEQLVRPGMKVDGVLDRAGRRLDVGEHLRGPESVRYQPGQVVLARVDAVDEGSAVLALHPTLTVTVPRELVSSNDLDRVDELMTVGEVLRARVTSTAPWTLRLDDIDDEEQPVSAVALLPGGPPWLREGLPDSLLDTGSEGESATPAPSPRELDPAWSGEGVVVEESVEAPGDDDVEPAAPPAPVPSAPPGGGFVSSVAQTLEATNEKLRAHQKTIESLFAERDRLASELESARHRIEVLRRELAERTGGLRKAVTTPNTADEGLYLDPVDQFNHEVYVAWARRIGATEKDDRPLCAYSLGPHFLDSVDHLQGISRAKIVDVVVEVLTGIATHQPGRALHPLRSALAGDSPQRVREDGSTAWRANLQSGSPSARRLHYWLAPDGSIELAKVVTHDDFTI